MLCIGPIISIFCRSSYSLISSVHSWNKFVILSPIAKAELFWRVENLAFVSSYPFKIEFWEGKFLFVRQVIQVT